MKTYKSKLNKISLVREEMELQRVKIGSSMDSAEYARNFYGNDLTINESFHILLLNNANNTIGYSLISSGGITGTVVDTRLVAKYALEGLATAVILVHNHPSGTLKPSQTDKDITKKLTQGLGLLDIRVLDHIILTENSYFSFADENLIK